MSGVSIKVTGTGKVIRKLTLIAERGSNVSPAWPEVAEMIAEEVGVNFDTQGGWFGAPWAPLAASTLAQGHPGPPLVKTGRLRSLLTGRRLPIRRMTNTTMTVGTTDRIATFQHGGTHMHGRRHIPPRVLLKSTARMRKQAARILGYYVMTGRS